LAKLVAALNLQTAAVSSGGDDLHPYRPTAITALHAVPVVMVLFCHQVQSWCAQKWPEEHNEGIRGNSDMLQQEKFP